MKLNFTNPFHREPDVPDAEFEISSQDAALINETEQDSHDVETGEDHEDTLSGTHPDETPADEDTLPPLPKTRPRRHLLVSDRRLDEIRDVLRQNLKRTKTDRDLTDSNGLEHEVTTPVNEETGLTDAQIAARTAAGRVNTVEQKGVRSTRRIIFSHTVTWFNFLNIFLGFLVYLTGEYKNMLFLGVIVSNSAIGIFQEMKVRDMIRSLSVITASKSRVLRNGETVEIPVSEIVMDEIIVLSPGDQIVTDGTVISSSGLEVNESMLTGEAKPVKKMPGDQLLSGSFVSSGTGRMHTEKVGEDCYAAGLVAKSRDRRRASSEMQITIRRIIKFVSIAIVPIGLLLYASQRDAAVIAAEAIGETSAHWIFSRAIVRTVSGIIGMIPEGLVLLTSVSFILGVGRLALKRALVQEMQSIESLARVNVLCTDKTGTITTGALQVSKLIAVGGAPDDYIHDAAAALNASFSDSNATQEALNEYFGKRSRWELIDSLPFSSDRKYRAALYEEQGAFYMGAPEILVPHRRDVMEYIDPYLRDGCRVLVLACGRALHEPEELRGNREQLIPIAIIVISDVVKEDAKDVFRYFAKSGVQVKVISGDNPVAVSAVAQKAGVAGAEHYVDASTLPEDPDELAAAIEKYHVFGRVKPEQKQAFVKAWQQSGNTVAMVGDGVNDVLAIKDADCGIAMANGSDAARQAAHIVLLDSDFSAMKDIVGEGKTIICNIERVSSLYLTKTIYSCLLCVIFIILSRSYPWTSLQMGLINVCCIGMPSFLLTLETHENWKPEGFLPHILKTCIPASLTMVVTILLIQGMGGLFGWADELISLFNLVMGGFVGMLVVAQVCWPQNLYRRFVFFVSAFFFVAGIILLPNFYDIHPLWNPWSLMMVLLGFIDILAVAFFSVKMGQFLEKMKEWRRRRREKAAAKAAKKARKAEAKAEKMARKAEAKAHKMTRKAESEAQKTAQKVEADAENDHPQE